MRSLRILALAALCATAGVLAYAQTAPPAQAPILTSTARFLPVIAKNGMVASQEKRATHVGVEILKAGGNAVDAAVAVGFALAVTHPQAGNIGGGGFMLVHLARAQRDDRDRLPRDRARRDDARFLPRRHRRGRPEEVARFSARRRRARHGRGTGARAREIWLGQVYAGAVDRARDRGSRAKASRSTTSLPTRCRARSCGSRAGPRRPGFFSGATARRSDAATG